MSGKRLQLKRGTTAQTSTFTGLNCEVTVDTTKKTLVVHDGSTVGGTVLAKDSDVVLKVDKVAGKQLSTEDYSTAEKIKLSGIAAGAQVNVPTDLSLGTITGAILHLNSSTGSDVVFPSATTTAAGLLSGTDKTKLDSISANANNYAHPASGVGAGTYKSVTVDANGHVTGGTNPTTVSGYGLTDVYTKTESNTSLALKVNNSEKGVANGVSTLDSNGKVVLAQIPDSVLGQLEYMGTWNFATLPTATQKGQYWIASTSGNGYIVGDWAVWNGTAFDQVDNTDAVATVAGRTGNVVLTKADILLDNVENTSDASKPVSTAQQTALNLKANLASPVFTGNVTGLGVATGTSFNSITGLSSVVGTTSGTAAIGTSTTAARADHVHPAQTTITGNAGTATTLATYITIGMTGDVTWTSASFNGSANVTGTSTLKNTGTAGTYRSVTTDAQGRVTSGTNPTTVTGYGITDAYTKVEVDTSLALKVDKVAGKGLSTEDYTSIEKTKLAGIAASANNYSLPIASASVLGGVKAGANITIDAAGVISASASGGAVPVGTIITVAKNTAPTEYLKANGALVSRTVYSALFAEIGTTFGAGDGSTTFALPDLRGEFIRGWDDGRGIDVGRVFGSFQADELKSHSHTYTVSNYAKLIDVSNGYGTRSQSVTDTGLTGGAETRPRNIALLYCIKY